MPQRRNALKPPLTRTKGPVPLAKMLNYFKGKEYTTPMSKYQILGAVLTISMFVITVVMFCWKSFADDLERYIAYEKYVSYLKIVASTIVVTINIIYLWKRKKKVLVTEGTRAIAHFVADSETSSSRSSESRSSRSSEY